MVPWRAQDWDAYMSSILGLAPVNVTDPVDPGGVGTLL